MVQFMDARVRGPKHKMQNAPNERRAIDSFQLRPIDMIIEWKRECVYLLLTTRLAIALFSIVCQEPGNTSSSSKLYKYVGFLFFSIYVQTFIFASSITHNAYYSQQYRILSV